jgi:hypothetical protein
MAKKIILIALGIFALLCGLAIAAGGAALLALGGRSGTIESGYHAVSTQTVAFVSDPARVRNSSSFDIKAGTATLTVDGRNSLKPVFIGVGPSDQVDAYVTGSPYEVVTDINFSPFRLTNTQTPGNDQPAAPADQSFWVAQATGLSPQLSWNISSGSYRVVVMNTDGSPGVGLDARVGLRVPALFPAGLVATIVGGLLSLLGLALLIWGIAAKRKRPPAAPVYPAGGYGYPQAPDAMSASGPAGGGYPDAGPQGVAYPGAAQAGGVQAGGVQAGGVRADAAVAGAAPAAGTAEAAAADVGGSGAKDSGAGYPGAGYPGAVYPNTGYPTAGYSTAPTGTVPTADTVPAAPPPAAPFDNFRAPSVPPPWPPTSPGSPGGQHYGPAGTSTTSSPDEVRRDSPTPADNAPTNWSSENDNRPDLPAVAPTSSGGYSPSDPSTDPWRRDPPPSS